MRLSVIIVSYKVPHYLQLCLESVTRSLTGIDSEIIVVDNASEDDTLAMVKTAFPQVKCIANTRNVGFSKANNQGVALASGEYVCILNPDTVVSESCFQEVLAFAENKENLGAVGVRLIDGTGNFLPESKRNLTTPKVSVQKLLGNSKSYYANNLDEAETGKVAILVGAFMFLKKQVYDEVGGFDELFFMYGEDIDLSYAITQKGYDNYYLGTTSVLHFKGESTVKDREYARRFYGAMRLFARKHFHNSKLIDLFLNFVTKSISYTYDKAKPVKKSNAGFAKQFWVSDASSLPEALKGKAAVLKWSELTDCYTVKWMSTRFIFDLQGSSTSQIIEIMQGLKNRQNTFRIRPSNCNFSCGSDSAAGRGEVEKWV